MRRGPNNDAAAILLDGLPPTNKKRRITGETYFMEEIPNNLLDDEDGEEILLIEVNGNKNQKDDKDEHIDFYALLADTIIEARLTTQERRAFDKAKDEALIPWCENAAWKPAKKNVIKPGEAVPL